MCSNTKGGCLRRIYALGCGEMCYEKASLRSKRGMQRHVHEEAAYKVVTTGLIESRAIAAFFCTFLFQKGGRNR